jgi:hypothetical protein
VVAPTFSPPPFSFRERREHPTSSSRPLIHADAESCQSLSHRRCLLPSSVSSPLGPTSSSLPTSPHPYVNLSCCKAPYGRHRPPAPPTGTRHRRQVFSASPPRRHLGEHHAASPCPVPTRGPLRASRLDLIIGRSPLGHRRARHQARARRGDHSVGAHRSAASMGRPKHLGRWASATVPGRGPKAGLALCSRFSYFPFPFIIPKIWLNFEKIIINCLNLIKI